VRDLVERADALLSGVGLEVAEDHLLDEEPRPRRPARRPGRRLRRGGLHGHLAIRRRSNKRGTARSPSAARRRRPEARSRSPSQLTDGRPPLPPRSLGERRGGIEAARKRGWRLLRGKLKWLRGKKRGFL
jgi:hypothetical protein